jgi:hypothetical protein
LTHSFARAHVSASDALALLADSDSAGDEPIQSQTKQSREKALFRSARASYALGRYGECVRTLDTLLKPDGRLVEAEDLKSKAQQRLKERDEGKYDWVKLVKLAKKLSEETSAKAVAVVNAEETDLADYFGPVEFKTSDSSLSSPSDTLNHKPKLFANRVIAPGELVLACPAISIVPTSPLPSSTPSFTFDASTGQITLRESPPAVRALFADVVRKARGWENLGRPGSKLGGVLRGGEIYGRVRVGGGSVGTVEGREEAPVRGVEGRCVVDA